jgi:nitrate/nitrite transporter NarK
MRPSEDRDTNEAAQGIADEKGSTLLGETIRPMSETPMRFLVLLCAALFMFGNYYFFDQTSATEDDIRSKTHMSEDTFGLLSSVYSWPNVVLPLFGGLLVDKMGIRVAVIGFTALIMLGSWLFTLGLWIESSALLIISRVIFGIGGESQCVASLTMVSKWFVGKELAFATSIIIAVSRLGSVAAFDTQPTFVRIFDVVGASTIGSMFCILSFCSAMVACFLDRYAARKDAARGLINNQVDAADETVRLQDIAKFGSLYWLVVVSLVAVYVAAFPFMQVISAPYLKSRFDFDSDRADNIVANINLVSALVSPFLGLIADRCGWRPLLLVVSAGTMCACHVTFMLFPTCYQCMIIVLPYIVMGAGLSVYGGVIWPCFPLVVEPAAVGTAFGLATALQNLGMAISPMILTALHSSTKSFTFPFVYIIACCGAGIMAAIFAWIIDFRTGQKLWRP